MANQQTLKVAIVGLSVGHAGTIGPEVTSFLHNFKSMEGVEVVAYCEEQKPETLKDADIHHPEASQYDSVDELIAKEDFDIASVVLTPRDLPGTALKLAEAGKHMFLDKQFSRTAPDLIPVVKAVRKSGVKTFLGYPWSYHPAMHDLKRMIDDGVFGKPLDIECRQVYWKVGPGGSDPDAVANRNDTEGGGVLHYVGCHHLELMRNLMGCEVKAVQAMTGRPVGVIEEPLEDVAILAMEYENGAYGSLHTGYTKPRGLGPDGYDSAMVYRGLEGWANWAPVGARGRRDDGRVQRRSRVERRAREDLRVRPGHRREGLRQIAVDARLDLDHRPRRPRGRAAVLDHRGRPQDSAVPRCRLRVGAHGQEGRGRVRRVGQAT